MQRNEIATCAVAPRLLRFRDAPHYLGMDRNRFNAEVRPHLTEIRIGRQGVAFDRLELDAWVDHYKSRNGRPAADPIGDVGGGLKMVQIGRFELVEGFSVLAPAMMSGLGRARSAFGSTRSDLDLVF